MATSSAHSNLNNEDGQAAVLKFLRREGAIVGGVTAREIDTHAASIFLAGDRAWKLKREVRFGYLDFSTVDKRRAALDAELILNRRTAPNLYIGVVPITLDGAGRFLIGGTEDPIDWLLEMYRFPDDALLAHLADQGKLGFDVLTRLTDRVVAFHADAEITQCDNAGARFRAVIDGNAASLASFPEILAPDAVVTLCATHCEAVSALAVLLDERGRAGCVRHAHGDLHLANIAMIDGAPTLFDCLEFSAELATIDVLYDVAFLVMDLLQRGMRTEANIVLNRYLDMSPADEAGIGLITLFISVRATVRAHVMAAQAMRSPDDPGLVAKAQAYLALAVAAMEPRPPRLVAIGGLSGTGKSSLAQMVARDIGRIPGARILRNDVLRKRLASVTPETRLAATCYTAAAADRVYEALDTAASATLANGQAVIADAVFAPGAERQKIEAVADAASCRFDGVWLTASDQIRLERVSRRKADASDADTDVALAQSHLHIGDLGSWRSLSADDRPDVVAARLRSLLVVGSD